MARTKAQRRAARRARRGVVACEAGSGGVAGASAAPRGPASFEEVMDRIEADLAALTAGPWYVAQTWANSERSVEEELKELGFGAYLPRETLLGVRRCNLASVKVLRPLFYGYVFVCVDEDAGQRFDQVREVVGVARMLTPSGAERPRRMPPLFVEKMRLMEEAGMFDRTGSLQRTLKARALQEGVTVRVARGPFTGWLASVLRARPGENRVRVLLSIFGRASELDFGVDEVDVAESDDGAARAPRRPVGAAA